MLAHMPIFKKNKQNYVIEIKKAFEAHISRHKMVDKKNELENMSILFPKIQSKKEQN